MSFLHIMLRRLQTYSFYLFMISFLLPTTQNSYSTIDPMVEFVKFKNLVCLNQRIWLIR
jgi:hypothetical protein